MSDQRDQEPSVIVERRSGGGIGLFLLGVAVGAGLALLYAPQSGARTRADLRRAARRAARRARSKAGDIVDAAKDAAGEARDALERRLARHGRGADAVDSEDTGA